MLLTRLSPLIPAILNKNQAYFGSNLISHSNGSLIHFGAAVNVPYKNTTGKSYDSRVPADATSIGSLAFIGRWNPAESSYTWESGAPVWLPPGGFRARSDGARLRRTARWPNPRGLARLRHPSYRRPEMVQPLK